MIEFAVIIVGFTIFLLMGMGYVAKRQLKTKYEDLHKTTLKGHSSLDVITQPLTNKQLNCGLNVIEYSGEEPMLYDEYWFERILAEFDDATLLRYFNKCYDIEKRNDYEVCSYLYINELEYRGIKYDL